MTPDATDLLRGAPSVRTSARADLFSTSSGPDNPITGSGPAAQAPFGAVISEARKAAESPRAERSCIGRTSANNCREAAPTAQLAGAGSATATDSPVEEADAIAKPVPTPETVTEEDEPAARIDTDTVFTTPAAAPAHDIDPFRCMPVATMSACAETATPNPEPYTMQPRSDRNSSAATAMPDVGQTGADLPSPVRIGIASAESDSAATDCTESDSTPAATGATTLRADALSARPALANPDQPAMPPVAQTHPAAAGAGITSGHPPGPPPGPGGPLLHGAAVATPMDQPGFPQALANEVGTLVLAGVGRAEIRLRPREMGPIHIELTVGDDGARIVFAATRPDTRTAIEQSLTVLREMLADRGLMLADAQISDNRAGAGFHQPPSHRHSAQPPIEPDRDAEASAHQGTGRPGTETLSIRSIGRLDLYA